MTYKDFVTGPASALGHPITPLSPGLGADCAHPLAICHRLSPALSLGIGVACTTHVPCMYLACTSQSPPKHMACTSHVPGFRVALGWLWGAYPLAINTL